MAKKAKGKKKSGKSKSSGGAGWIRKNFLMLAGGVVLGDFGAKVISAKVKLFKDEAGKPNMLNAALPGIGGYFLKDQVNDPLMIGAALGLAGGAGSSVAVIMFPDFIKGIGAAGETDDSIQGTDDVVDQMLGNLHNVVQGEDDDN